jgi:UPF0042 nucleotide-binding protein
MQLAIISGRSGSGKTTALQILEDLNFFCVDNLPLFLLPNLIQEIQEEKRNQTKLDYEHIAVGIDARNLASQIGNYGKIIEALEQKNIECSTIYLDSKDEILLRRFNASRRKHPLSNEDTSLAEAIANEEQLLKPIEDKALLSIDTSSLTVHQLRETIKQQIFHSQSQQTSILIQSFSYKHGIPIDADFVFDVRCLKNPHWEESLKALSGLDKSVQKFLEQDAKVNSMLEDISRLLKKWTPEFEANNRSYLSIAIGCTGGQHRSVFMAEKLAEALQDEFSKIQIRHRELNT